MAVSDVAICNRALNAIGQESITALDEGTTRAVICNRLYTELRDELLQDHPWNFATKRTALAASVDTPAYEWDYQYPFPADAVRILSVNEDYQKVEWWSEGRNILTNWESPIYCKYISNDLDEITFPPKFVTALAARLAVELAMPLTESSSRREAMAKEYQIAIRAARGADARESAPAVYKDDTLLDARL